MHTLRREPFDRESGQRLADPAAPRRRRHREHPELALARPRDLPPRRTGRAHRHRAEQHTPVLTFVLGQPQLRLLRAGRGVTQVRDVRVRRAPGEVGVRRDRDLADRGQVFGPGEPDPHGQMPKVARGYAASTSVITLTR